MLYHYIQRDCLKHGLAVPVVVRTATKQQGSFVVLADEQPRGERREVLLMSGMMGAKKDRIPLLFGDDSTVSNIIGSVLVRVQLDDQSSRVVGVLGFASDPQAQAIRDRYLSGEVKASLCTRPITGVELRAGEKFLEVVGPAIVLTEWQPFQVVLCAAA